MAGERRRCGLDEWADLIEGDALRLLGDEDDVFDLDFLDAEKGDYDPTVSSVTVPLDRGLELTVVLSGGV